MQKFKHLLNDFIPKERAEKKKEGYFHLIPTEIGGKGGKVKEVRQKLNYLLIEEFVTRRYQDQNQVLERKHDIFI
jgi:hypothetical protein